MITYKKNIKNYNEITKVIINSQNLYQAAASTEKNWKKNYVWAAITFFDYIITVNSKINIQHYPFSFIFISWGRLIEELN